MRDIISFEMPRGCNYSNHYSDRNAQVIAWDAEPIRLKNCPQNPVVQKTSHRLRSFGDDDLQPYLWSDNQSSEYDNYIKAYKQAFSWYYEMDSMWGNRNYTRKERYFTSSVANGTSTGVYRHHAVRMDSTAKCSRRQNFPKSCKGAKPFQTSFSSEVLNIDICVEGNYEITPWNTSRNKQEHLETMWLAMNLKDGASQQNYVLQCSSESRRGWFELPNVANKFKAGPLLDKWPSKNEIMNVYNDIWDTSAPDAGRYPAEYVTIQRGSS